MSRKSLAGEHSPLTLSSMPAVYMERSDRNRNLARYYHVEIQPTLFGEWAVIRLWCKQLGNRGSWQDASVPCGRGAVHRAAFRPADHHPLCELVCQFQIELQRLGDHDGGSRYLA